MTLYALILLSPVAPCRGKAQYARSDGPCKATAYWRPFSGERHEDVFRRRAPLRTCAVSHAYAATVSWERRGAKFTDNKYSRTHEWRFDGGTVVRASASPAIVPLPLSDADAVDPEEAFVASL